jgi:hypothetical protein
MTNNTLLFLSEQTQLLTANNLTLEGKAAYNVYKFTRSLQKALYAFNAERMELTKKVFGDDLNIIAEIEQKLVKKEELSEEEKNTYDNCRDKRKSFTELVLELGNEEITLTNACISYEDYHLFKKENNLPSFLDTILEGVLWRDEED